MQKNNKVDHNNQKLLFFIGMNVTKVFVGGANLLDSPGLPPVVHGEDSQTVDSLILHVHD